MDSAIGDTVTNAMLGHDAKETAITGVAGGIVFAFVSGLAGTFTACNIAVFGTMAPLVGGAGGKWHRVLAALRPLWWLAAGMIVVSAAYGVVVGLVGTGMPQFGTAQSAPASCSATRPSPATRLRRGRLRAAVARQHHRAGVLVLLVNVVAGGAMRRWFVAEPRRLTVLTGSAPLGVVRLPVGRRGQPYRKPTLGRS